MMKVKKLREDAVEIFRAGVEAVDPERAVLEVCRREGEGLIVAGKAYDLKSVRRLLVVGAGKASAVMASALEKLLGRRIDGGWIQVKYGHGVPLEHIAVMEAGHPVPDKAGLEGAAKILSRLGDLDGRDLVFVLISGGGSALLPVPAPGITLEDKRIATQALIESGASIQEINAVRKHISGIKGGRLAQASYPASVVCLILSDVIGDDLESIASGPTAPDTTTYGDCLSIIDSYELKSRIPRRVLEHLEKGRRGEVPETPKPGDPVFKSVQNSIVADIRLAVLAAKEQAVALGYGCLILSTQIDGETSDVARVHAAIAREVRQSGNPVPAPACLLSGGETTVTIRGGGRGGRNQEFTLAASLAIEGMEGCVVLSGGTDGTDGPTEAAGALADGSTVSRARALGIDARAALRDNDSYHVFEPLGDLLITGPTRTNVMDLRVILIR